MSIASAGAEMSPRVLGYVRVSTDEQSQSGAGLEAQRAAIVAECERRGWQLLEIVEDAGYSAKDMRRPGIQSALKALKTGRADVLMAAKLDRLSRSSLDFATLMAFGERQGWAAIALDCPADTTTPTGEAMASMMATFSQLERRLIGQRTRDALAVKRAQGVRLGRPPVLSDAVRARIRADRGAGLTLRAIADALNAEGVPTAHGGARWHASTVRAVLAR